MSVEQFGYKQELHRALTFRDLLVYGMIFMVPIAPFGVFGYVWDGAQGMVALAYLIGMVAMFFTAMSYWSMSRAFPVSGSVYAYAQRGIHPIVGFFAGWLILLDYILVPSLLYIVSAAALAPMLPGVPGWLWIVGFIAINSLINLRGITFTARANNTILIAEIVVLSVFVVLGLIALYSGAGAGHLTLDPLYNADKFSLPLVMGAVSIAVLSFLGFDGISSLSEETKDAERVIPKAIFLTALIGGLIFIGASYFLQLYFPDISRFKDPDASQPEIMLYVAGKTFQWGVLIFSSVTVLASGMAAHAGVSRLMYVMGRDGVFPTRFFGYVHPKWRTPAWNVLLVGAIALLAIKFDLVTATALINFGALVAFTFVNLSVISQFWIREKRNKTLKDHFNYLVLPVCGALTVGALWINLEESSMVLGLIWGGIGLVSLACVTKSFRNPVPQYEDVA